MIYQKGERAIKKLIENCELRLSFCVSLVFFLYKFSRWRVYEYVLLTDLWGE
jgi:hypothetical protein